MLPETCAIPAVITTMSSDCVRPRKKGTNREWSFGLAHYDRGRHVERLRTAGPHRLLHHSGDHANQKLHDAEVVQNGEKSGDEDDGRQHLEGEDKTETGVLRPGFSKDKARAREGAGEQTLGAFSGLCDRQLSPPHLGHQDGKKHLQRDSRGHHAPANGFAVGGKKPGSRQHQDQSKHSSESSHRFPLSSPHGADSNRPALNHFLN